MTSCIRYGCERAIVEERGVFGNINPDDHCRPDISVLNPDKLLLDFVVTRPLPCNRDR